MEDDSHAGPSPYRWPLALQQQRAPLPLLLVLFLATHVSSSIAQLDTTTPALVTAARDVKAETAVVADQQQHGGGSTYSALCVVAKDENRYIAEWVQYHKCLGECVAALTNDTAQQWQAVLDERWLTDSARAHPSSKGYPPVLTTVAYCTQVWAGYTCMTTRAANPCLMRYRATYRMAL